MTTRQISKNVLALCTTSSNSAGFKHHVVLALNGVEQKKVSVQYYNRTWEAKTFDTVIHKAVDKNKGLISEEDMIEIKKYLNS